MKRLGIMVAALMFAVAAIGVSPQRAEARGGGGAIVAGIIGAAVIGGIIAANSRHRHYRSYGYYRRPYYGPSYAYYGPRYYRPVRVYRGGFYGPRFYRHRHYHRRW